MNLENYISELLENHDCVIVPAFGGFVANYAPASVNPINDRFDPPYRKVSFNKFLVHNDGLLAAYVAQKEQEEYEKSLERVKNFALYLKRELKDHNRVSINKVGIIYLQQDETFRFEQIKNADFFKSAFRLESFFASRIERTPSCQVSIDPKTEEEKNHVKAQLKVIALPISKQVEPEKKPKIQASPKKEIPEEKVSEEPRPKKKRNWAAAAAIISLPLIGLGIWLGLGRPLLNDHAFNYSNLNPFTANISSTYETRTFSYSPEEFKAIEEFNTESSAGVIKLELRNEADKTLVVSLSKAEKPASAITLHYHIMGGCFSVEENATGLVDTYNRKGNNASLIDIKGDLYRVSIASFATKKEAKAALTSFRNDILGAWILYK